MSQAIVNNHQLLMLDSEKQNRFIQLRAQGWSFVRIATELEVAKSTLIEWSRKCQHEIQNLRAIQKEAWQEQYCLTQELRIQSVGDQLKLVQGELARRDISTIPTWRLFALAATLRREAEAETGQLQLRRSTEDLQPQEVASPTLDWSV